MTTYTTKMFDRIDRICEERYGDTKNGIVEYVIAHNVGLEKYGIVLPHGIVVNLPQRPQSQIDQTPVVDQIRLWD